jgi:hypothetical protein
LESTVLLYISISASSPSDLELLPSTARGSIIGSDRMVDEGDTLKLKCKVGRLGNPQPAIRWEKNGYQIQPGFRSRIKNKK